MEGSGDVPCEQEGAVTDPSLQECNDNSPFTWKDEGDIFACPFPDRVFEFLDVLALEDSAAGNPPCPSCVCP